MVKKIYFGKDESGDDKPWHASNDEAFLRIADKITGRHVAFKLYFMAQAHSNKIGHAEYRPGELAGRLGLSDQGLRSAIKQAKDFGLIEDESCSRCIVFSQDLIQYGGKGSSACKYHQIGMYEGPRRR